jgi:hypothetical protein
LDPRLSRVLTGAAVTAGAVALSAFGFVAFLAPSWPRTGWGWLLSAALGLPLLVAFQFILALCFSVGPPRFHFVRRVLPSGVHVFPYRAGSRTARAVLLAVRILAAVALCGLVVWLLYAVVLGNATVRAQFR